jgi:large subunit ribosomal protein L18
MKNLNKNRVFRFNRRIRGLTNYNLRLKLLKSNLTRVVVRRSNKNMLVQFVKYGENGDQIVTSSKSIELTKLGYNLNTGNLTAAYLTGMLAGKKALKAGIKDEVIVDLGLQKSIYGSRIYAAIKGIKDSGMNIKVSDVVFPAQERLNGEHLQAKDAKKVIEATKKKIEEFK